VSVSLAKPRHAAPPSGPVLREVTHIVRAVLVVVDTLRAADVGPGEHLAELDGLRFDPPALVEAVHPEADGYTATLVVWGRSSMIELIVDGGAPARVLAEVPPC
jgi:hypothetical protein